MATDASNDSRTIFVAIEDANFFRAVQTGAEDFRKGDILQVKLQTRLWREGEEIKAEHAIIQGLDHHSAPLQQRLSLHGGDGSEYGQ